MPRNIIGATDFPFGNRSRNTNIRTRAVIKIIFCNKFIMQAFKKHSFHLQAKSDIFCKIRYFRILLFFLKACIINLLPKMIFFTALVLIFAILLLSSEGYSILSFHGNDIKCIRVISPWEENIGIIVIFSISYFLIAFYYFFVDAIDF